MLVYPTGAPAIALGPGGAMAVTSRTAQILAGKNNSTPYVLYFFISNNAGSTWEPAIGLGEGDLPAWSSENVAVAVDGNGAAHSFLITKPYQGVGGYDPTLKDVVLAPGATLTGEIYTDYPSGADPLGWYSATWSAGGYELPGSTKPVPDWGFSLIPGMTVRASGEVDVAFWNFINSSLVLFTLPLGASAWNFNFVGFPDQQ